METSGFRIVLVAGAVLFGFLGVTAWIAPAVFTGLLGMDIPVASSGFDALARLYGGLCVVVAGGYAIAAADMSKNRGLLAILFWVPIVNIMASVAAITGEEFSIAGALLFAGWNLALALTFFRFYPRGLSRKAIVGEDDTPPTAA